MHTSTRLFLILLLILAAPLSSCGGGGGGSGSSAPADISLHVEPSRIDSGDRVTVRVEISDIDPLGVGLKFRYPNSFLYIRGSAFMFVGRKRYDLSPTPEDSDATHTYLVFYLTQAMLEPEGAGTIELFLEGISVEEDAPIEIDADVDDPTETNETEFQISDPRFEAQDEARIDIEGEESSESSSSSSSSSGSSSS